LFVGTVRSGSKDLGIELNLPGEKVFSHHLLVPATTGRGKSNLVKIMMWSVIDKDYCGLLVLDPHDEYYGRKDFGMKDHPQGDEKVIYYSLNPPPGAATLKINVEKLKPWHFDGVIDFSTAQKEATYAFYKKHGEDWIRQILTSESDSYPTGIKEESVGVVARKLSILGISAGDAGELECSGIFSTEAGKTTIDEIAKDLQEAKTVIIDTSSVSGESELLVGSMVVSEVFSKYKKFKKSGELATKPVVSVVIEEAPRVLGKEVLKAGPNIFSTIAREGRKFRVGLLAITQIPSEIPRQVLANMNTKLVLGLEMEPERKSIIESASQDLSKDSRSIASLDIGEALVTSNFTKFAIPISVPYFCEEVFGQKKEESMRDFSGFS
jgi:hypothetical protein